MRRRHEYLYNNCAVYQKQHISLTVTLTYAQTYWQGWCLQPAQFVEEQMFG